MGWGYCVVILSERTMYIILINLIGCYGAGQLAVRTQFDPATESRAASSVEIAHRAIVRMEHVK